MAAEAFLEEHGLVTLEVAFCKGCHEELSEQIIANYKAMERFREGAKSLEDPALFIETNVIGTLNVLDAVRKSNIRMVHLRGLRRRRVQAHGRGPPPQPPQPLRRLQGRG